MNKFKVGDEVVLVNGKRNPCVLKNGATGVVLSNSSIPFVQFNIDPNECLHDASWFHGENGKCWAVCESELNGVPVKLVDNSIDIETESLCIEKRFELEPKTVVPVATIYPVRNNVKSKTEVNKSIVWFILFVLAVIVLMLISGIYKSIF